MAIALGPFLSGARKRQRMSQETLRDVLKEHGFEYSTGNIGHWEQGRHVPPLALTNAEDETLGKVLAEILNVPVADLLTAAGFLSFDREAHHATLQFYPFLDEANQHLVDELVMSLLEGNEPGTER